MVTCHQWYPNGSVLFHIYINNLPEVIDVMIKQFAYDANIYDRVHGRIQRGFRGFASLF